MYFVRPVFFFSWLNYAPSSRGGMWTFTPQRKALQDLDLPAGDVEVATGLRLRRQQNSESVKQAMGDLTRWAPCYI